MCHTVYPEWSVLKIINFYFWKYGYINGWQNRMYTHFGWTNCYSPKCRVDEMTSHVFVAKFILKKSNHVLIGSFLILLRFWSTINRFRFWLSVFANFSSQRRDFWAERHSADKLVHYSVAQQIGHDTLCFWVSFCYLTFCWMLFCCILLWRMLFWWMTFWWMSFWWMSFWWMSFW